MNQKGVRRKYSRGMLLFAKEMALAKDSIYSDWVVNFHEVMDVRDASGFERDLGDSWIAD